MNARARSKLALRFEVPSKVNRSRWLRVSLQSGFGLPSSKETIHLVLKLALSHFNLHL